ncbi:MAG: hypothetical protein NXI31_17550 [bacterium]|nr:hypothetical protein [bacterium]
MTVRLVVVPVLIVSAVAQTPTITGTITQELSVRASSSTMQQQVVPVGPLPSGGATLWVSTPGAAARMRWEPTTGHPAGVAGFELHASGWGILSWTSGAGSFSNSGRVVLDFTMPTPTPMLLHIQGTNQIGGITQTDIDIDDDGSVEASLTGLTPSGQIDLEIGLLVGPGGRSIGLQHSSSGAALFANVSAFVDVELTAYANAYPVEAYGTGCIAQTYTRDATGAVTLRCPASAGSLAAYALGLNPTQIALPFTPGCFQLTDVLYFLPVVPAGGEANLPLSLPALPPGLAVHMQAVVLDSNNVITTSNGLRVVGPN